MEYESENTQLQPMLICENYTTSLDGYSVLAKTLYMLNTMYYWNSIQRIVYKLIWNFHNYQSFWSLKPTKLKVIPVLPGWYKPQICPALGIVLTPGPVSQLVDIWHFGPPSHLSADKPNDWYTVSVPVWLLYGRGGSSCQHTSKYILQVLEMFHNEPLISRQAFYLVFPLLTLQTLYSDIVNQYCWDSSCEGVWYIPRYLDKCRYDIGSSLNLSYLPIHALSRLKCHIVPAILKQHIVVAPWLKVTEWGDG